MERAQLHRWCTFGQELVPPAQRVSGLDVIGSGHAERQHHDRLDGLRCLESLEAVCRARLVQKPIENSLGCVIVQGRHPVGPRR
jgi:hypothetical protein